MSDQDFGIFERLLASWDELADHEGEKIYWLSCFDGDVEKAKYAYIRHHSKDHAETKPNLVDPPTASSKQGDYGKKTYFQRVWNGEENLWGVWAWSVVVPNILLGFANRPLMSFVVSESGSTLSVIAALSPLLLSTLLLFVFAKSAIEQFKTDAAERATWSQIFVYCYILVSFIMSVFGFVWLVETFSSL